MARRRASLPSASVPAVDVVRDPAAAALLVDSRRNRFLRPFLARECGVAEAARELGVGRSLVSYWVGRFCAVGLLAAQDSGGERHRRYRTTADSFTVSLDDVPLSSDAALLSANMDGFFERLKLALVQTARRNAPAWEFRYLRTPQGVRETIAPRAGEVRDARLVNERAALHLGESEAAALRAELEGVMRRYTALSRPGGGRKRVLAWMACVDDL